MTARATNTTVHLLLGEIRMSNAHTLPRRPVIARLIRVPVDTDSSCSGCSSRGPWHADTVSGRFADKHSGVAGAAQLAGVPSP